MTKWVLWLENVLLVTIGGPLFTLVVEANNAMLILMLLLFVLHPLCALYSGIFAGGDVRKRWWLPLAHSALFAIGAWWILSMDIQGLYVYSPIYLAIGFVTMGITAVLCVKSREKNAEDAR